MNENKTCRGQWLRHILFTALGFVVCMLIIVGTQAFYKAKLIYGLELDAFVEETYQAVYISSEKCENFPYSKVDNFYLYPLEAYVYRDGRDSNYEIIEVLNAIDSSENEVLHIYLELNPLLHNNEDIISFIEQQSEIVFYIFLRPYSIEEWNSVQDKGLMDIYMDAYQVFAEELVSFENTRVYYTGNKDWITENPYYFSDATQLSENALLQMYSEIECNIHEIMHTQLTVENLEASIVVPDLEIKEYVDLEGTNIFYFGDSMYAKDKDESGIAEISSKLVGANVFNWAIMGTSITGDDSNSFRTIAEILVASQADDLDGIEIPDSILDIVNESIGITPDIVVIRYGYNDYLGQCSVADDGIFKNNLREGIETLQNAFPDVKIILSTPTVSTLYFDNAITLEDYADAMQELADELGVYCLYNYNVDIFNEGDPNETLIDCVHYTVKGRFRQAERLAEYITSIYIQ